MGGREGRREEMPWLTAFTGTALESFEEYDGVAFDGRTFEDVRVGNVRFTECWIGRTTFERCAMVRSSLTDSVCDELRLVSTSLAGSQWRDVTVRGAMLAAVDIAGSELRRLTFSDCKFETVNLRAANLTDVTFDECVLNALDLTGATLTNCVFRNCRISALEMTKAKLTSTDLRTSSLKIHRGHLALSGAIIDPVQLLELAPALAQQLGIDVRQPT